MLRCAQRLVNTATPCKGHKNKAFLLFISQLSPYFLAKGYENILSCAPRFGFPSANAPPSTTDRHSRNNRCEQFDIGNDETQRTRTPKAQQGAENLL